MEKEIRKWLPLGGFQGINWTWQEGNFWGGENVAYVVLSGGYMYIYNYHN